MRSTWSSRNKRKKEYNFSNIALQDTRTASIKIWFHTGVQTLHLDTHDDPAALKGFKNRESYSFTALSLKKIDRL